MQEYYKRKIDQRQEDIMAGLISLDQSAHAPPVMFIVKPEANCQGKGIFVVKTLDELKKKVDQNLNS